MGVLKDVPRTSDILSKTNSLAAARKLHAAIMFVHVLLLCTRPDIAQAVGALSKYMAEPTTLH